MKKVLMFCMLSLFGIKMVQAHNPLSAMYYFEVKDNLGILNISISQAGFQEALTKHYPETDFDGLTEAEYKQLAVEYVKDNFYLRINGNRIDLLNGGLKLGNHQTDLKFITSELPKEFDTLNITISAFRENEHHQTIFSLSFDGETDKVILTENNDYSASVAFKDNKMIADNGKFNGHYLWFIAVIPLIWIGRKVLK